MEEAEDIIDQSITKGDMGYALLIALTWLMGTQQVRYRQTNDPKYEMKAHALKKLITKVEQIVESPGSKHTDFIGKIGE